jgi:hypothetical protein
VKDYIALVTVELRKFARQIAGGERPGKWRKRSLRMVGPMSAIAVHEKAGRSQVGASVFSLNKFSPAESPLSLSFHRALEERSVSLGASWVFSFQPVLPPDCRPLFPS